MFYITYLQWRHDQTCWTCWSDLSWNQNQFPGSRAKTGSLTFFNCNSVAEERESENWLDYKCLGPVCNEIIKWEVWKQLWAHSSSIPHLSVWIRMFSLLLAGTILLTWEQTAAVLFIMFLYITELRVQLLVFTVSVRLNSPIRLQTLFLKHHSCKIPIGVC